MLAFSSVPRVPTSPPRRLVTAIALVALIGAGCSNAPAGTGSGGSGGRNDPAEVGTNPAAVRELQEKLPEYAECMRENGVGEFPDPDPSGELTIDGVLNGSSLDPSTRTWKQAIAACQDLQPPGFTGDDEVTAEEQELRLEFAQCMRDNGVEDFPDPAKGEPLVDTRRIPSAAEDGGLGVINAAMRACGDVAAEASGR